MPAAMSTPAAGTADLYAIARRIWVAYEGARRGRAINLLSVHSGHVV
jgi:hypothetical protein